MACTWQTSGPGQNPPTSLHLSAMGRGGYCSLQ